MCHVHKNFLWGYCDTCDQVITNLHTICTASVQYSKLFDYLKELHSNDNTIKNIVHINILHPYTTYALWTAKVLWTPETFLCRGCRWPTFSWLTFALVASDQCEIDGVVTFQSSSNSRTFQGNFPQTHLYLLNHQRYYRQDYVYSWVNIVALLEDHLMHVNCWLRA